MAVEPEMRSEKLSIETTDDGIELTRTTKEPTSMTIVTERFPSRESAIKIKEGDISQLRTRRQIITLGGWSLTLGVWGYSAFDSSERRNIFEHLLGIGSGVGIAIGFIRASEKLRRRIDKLGDEVEFIKKN